MNFVSKFDGSLPFTGTHPKAQLQVETVQTKAPSDAIVVKDANLLFNGDFKRTGLDLVISRDDQELLLPDYFKGDKRAPLASSDGAYLTGKTIEVLTGHVQVAQADGSAAAAKIIGHVTKLSGSATVVRNGVSIILNNGDNVYQGDVVQSGSNSTVGITFIDGSVFGLASNARMVLNEMVYDPNGSGNSSLLSLVQGTISFVAGATAKHGDMKVDTPVATMGIRGTAVLVEIDFEVTVPGTAPPVRFQVLVEPDGTTGSYVLLDRVTLTQIATVNQPGTVTTVSGAGAVSFLASAQLSPELMKLISEVFSQKFTDNANPKSNTNFTDTVIPQATFPVQLASGEIGTATVTVILASEGPGGPPVPEPKSPDRIPGPPGVVTFNQLLAERVALTGSSLIDTTSGNVSYTDLNPGDVPTVSTAFSTFAYANAAGVTVTSTLTSAQLSAIAAASVPLSVVQDPAGKNNGTAIWTYNVEDNALDFLAQGEKLTLTYMARVDNNFAANNEFSFAPFTITITGTNDTPTIESEAQTAEIEELESEVDSDTLDTATGTIEFEDVDLTDTHDVTITDVSASGTVTGLPGGALPNLSVLNWLSLGAFVDSTDGVIGSQVWNFSAEDHYFDYLAEGETLELTYTVEVEDNNGATVTEDVVVTVTGTNDDPMVATADVTGGVTELVTPAGDLTDTGTIAFTDVDLSDTHTISPTITASVGALGSLTASVTTDTTGTGLGGVVTWDYTVEASYVEYLAAGEVKVESFTITLDDGNGGLIERTIDVTITGTNDAPVVAVEDVTGGVTELVTPTGDLTDTGTIAFTDVDLIDTHTISPTITASAGALGSLTASVTTDTTGSGLDGVVTWDYSVAASAVEYLAEGETKVETFTITLDDGNGGLIERTISVTITGTNDAPVVAVEDVTGGVTELVTPAGDLTDTGTIAFTDVDLIDIHSITPPAGALGSLTASVTTDTTGSGLGGVVTWDYSVAASAVEYLAEDETKVETFTITLDDGNGGLIERTVEVTITGTNDDPVVAVEDVTGGVTELVTPTGDLTDTGTIAFTDVDLIDTHTISPTITASAGALGSLTASVTTDTTGSGLDGVVTWNYTVAASAVEYLAEGETKVETFSITLDDGNGGLIERTITVTITGTNDAPVITSNGGDETASVSVDENTTAITTVTSIDVDGGTPAYSIVTGTGSPDAALFTINSSTGELSFIDPPDFEAPGSAAGSNVYTVQVQVADGAGGFDTQTLTVTVTDVGETLQANADTVSTDEDTAITLSTLTANDLTTGGTPTIVSVGNAVHGTVTLNGGSPVFTPESGFSGQASFTYWVTEAENPAPAGTFQAPISSATGSGPYAVGTSDLNGDGKLDLVVTNNTGANLSVMMGNGDGTFGPQTTFATGVHPFAVALRDIDGDNDVDIVVANLGSHSISVMLGDGTGSFAAQQTYATGTTHPQAVQLGDFNNDGKLDVVTSGASGNAISLLLGNGDGTFGTATTFATAGYATGVEIGDFNGDGKLDVVSSNYNTDTVSVLLGDGLGGFSPYSIVSVGDYVIGVVVADFNGDGKLDFATANNSSNDISVLIGNGDGTFQTQVNYATGTGPAYIATTDFDQDGTLDLVVTNTSNTVSVFRGNGNGTFAAAVDYAAATTPGRVATGDFNGDGLVDIAVADSASDTVNVLLNGPAGETLSSATVTVDVAPVADAPVLSLDPTPQALGNEFRVNTVTSNDQSYSAIGALSDGGFVIAWNSSGEDGSGQGIYAQRYDSSGAAVGQPFQVNTATADDQSSPFVAGLTGGGFVVAFVTGANNAAAVHGQRYDSSGTAVGGEFVVAAGENPTVAALANGGFVVTSVGLDSDTGGTFATIYDASGAVAVSTFLVNTTTASQQQGHSVAATSDGGFIVAWHSYGQDEAGSWGIYFQRFDADGNTLGSETRANTTVAGNQYGAELAVLEDGTFVVSWIDTPSSSLVIQHFAADGTAVGPELVIAGVTTTDTLQALPDGGYLVTYTASDGNGSVGVFGQRVSASNTLSGDAFQINQTTAGDQSFLNDRSNPTAVLSSGAIVSTWFGAPNVNGTEIYARLFTVPGVGEQGTEISLPSITAAVVDTDGSETLVLKLSGFPVGSTFSLGAAGTGADAGKWIISGTDVALLATTALTFTSPTNFSGDFTLHVESVVSDTATLSTGSVTDTITAAFDLPVTVVDSPSILQANADIVFTDEDTAVTLSTLTANDTTVGGSPPQIVSVYNAEHGTVALNNGVPVFTPDPGFTGTASFSYWIGETANPTPPGTIEAAVNYSIGAYPQAVTLADINDDGILDILVSNYTSNTISFKYGNGDGTFESSLHQLSAGANPSTPIVVADFNNDDNMDLAVGNFGSDNISIFYSNGSGGYNAAINYAAGDGPEGLSGADVNGDGNVDLIVSNYNAGTVAVTLSNGNGTFQSPVAYAVGGTAGSLPYLSALADLDGDGNLDIVVGNAGSSNVSVLLGNGNGTFEAAVNYATPAGSNAVAIGDVNGDGILDIVSSNGTASVFLGNGDGTFQSQTSYAAGDRTKGIALADFDEDGDLDIVVANSRDPNISPTQPQTNSVSILFNNGNGTFGAPVSYATGWDTYGVAVADLNGDGRPDIVAPNELSDDVSVLLNASPGGPLSSTTVTVNVVQTAGPMQLVGHALLGGSGDQAASSVEYLNGHLYLTYNGPVFQTTSDYANVVSFSTALSAPPTQDFSLAWTKGFFNGVTSDGTNIYAVGASHPGTLLTSDGSGGAEVKTLLAMFDANGTAGTNPSFAPATDYAATNFFSYRGVEIFYDVLATEQGGETVLYAVGFGQPSSYGAYIIAAYDANGNLLHSAVDPLPVPGFSIAYEAVEFNGQIWAVGYTEHSGDPVGRAVVWAASYDLSTVVTYKNEIETSPASFNGAAVIGSNLYAVGYVGEPNQYLITKYNTDGSIAWSTSFGGAGDDVLTGAVSINGHLYVAGYTTDTSGNTDGVLMEISTVNGSVISTTSYGGALYDAFNSITTDGHYLYVAGESNSFTNGGNGAGENDAILLTFDPGLGPVINTEGFTVTESGNTSIVTDLKVTTTAAGAVYTLTAETGAAPGTSVTPASTSGSLAQINTALETVGLTYDPGTGAPETDMVTLTVTDDLGNSDIVNFIFNEAGTGPTVTLTGTAEKDVIFATGYDDVLTGGAKADQFVFTPEDAAGDDIITDFTLGEDRIDLRAFEDLDTANIEAWLTTSGYVVQDGANTVITLDEDNTVTLTNVSAASLSASNFIVSQHQVGL